MTDPVIVTDHLTKRYGKQRGVVDLTMVGQARRGLWLPWPQWGRQDDDHPHP